MNHKTISKTWDKEAESYRFEKDVQVDYLANYYHLKKCFGIISGKKILEVGSGTGQSSAYLASQGGKVHLVDISKKALLFSRKYFASRGLPVKMFCQNAFSMKFPAESFDYVWNGGVIEHFNDKKKVEMLKKMWKLVKPGGKLVITAPNAWDFSFIVAKNILLLRNKWTFGFEDDLTLPRMRNLARLAEINNFSIYSYNPVIGYWFFPFGREITNMIGLNRFRFHKLKSPVGHVIIFSAMKSSKR